MNCHAWRRGFGKSMHWSLNNLLPVTDPRFVKHPCYSIIHPYFKMCIRNFQFLRSALSIYEAEDHLI